MLVGEHAGRGALPVGLGFGVRLIADLETNGPALNVRCLEVNAAITAGKTGLIGCGPESWERKGYVRRRYAARFNRRTAGRECHRESEGVASSEALQHLGSGSAKRAVARNVF